MMDVCDIYISYHVYIGRYAMCCFSLAKDKSFRTYCEELCAEYNDNVAWFNCLIKDQNFENAMLTYEFNDTPAVVVCKDGELDKLTQYMLGWNRGDEKKQAMKDLMKNKAAKFDVEGLQGLE